MEISDAYRQLRQAGTLIQNARDNCYGCARLSAGIRRWHSDGEPGRAARL